MSRGGTPWERSDKLALASLLLSIAAVLVTIAPPVYRNFTEPSASISTPQDKEKVTGVHVSVAGESAHLGADRDPWLILRPAGVDQYFPVQLLTVQDDGSWSATTDYVTFGNVGEYRLLVYNADSESSAHFRTYIKKYEGNSAPPGIPSIPSGAVLLDSITVTRTG